MDTRKFLWDYRSVIIISVALAFVSGLYMAIDWRDHTVCYGDCNWEKIKWEHRHNHKTKTPKVIVESCLNGV